MIFHLSCQENPNVTAILKIDYARNQLEKAKLEITNTTLSDKKKNPGEESFAKILHRHCRRKTKR